MTTRSETIPKRSLDPPPEPGATVSDAEVMDELNNGEVNDYFDEDALIEAGLLMCFGQFAKAKTMFSIVRERAMEKAHAALVERRLHGGR